MESKGSVGARGRASLASLGMEHPQTQQILLNHLTLLAQVHTNGDLEALLQLLAQGEQDDHVDEDVMQE